MFRIKERNYWTIYENFWKNIYNAYLWRMKLERRKKGEGMCPYLLPGAEFHPGQKTWGTSFYLDLNLVPPLDPCKMGPHP